MLTYPELKKLNDTQLHKELREARLALAEMRLNIKGNQARSIHKYHEQKKYVAQILTSLSSLANATKKVGKPEAEKATIKA